jgi:hypothetical protein
MFLVLWILPLLLIKSKAKLYINDGNSLPQAVNTEIKFLKLAPYRETADIDEANNSWPRKYAPTR